MPVQTAPPELAQACPAANPVAVAACLTLP